MIFHRFGDGINSNDLLVGYFVLVQSPLRIPPAFGLPKSSRTELVVAKLYLRHEPGGSTLQYEYRIIYLIIINR